MSDHPEAPERLTTLEVKLSALIDQMPRLFERQADITKALQRIDSHLLANDQAFERRFDSVDRLVRDHEERLRSLERSQSRSSNVISIIERIFWIAVAAGAGLGSRLLSV